ncbi:membrane protein [Staphylococcus agnetis]|uniref:DUF805 domain-containing protein n=1 Tax=Staphylococcus agnetis TaxID=985762 RepID=UPI000E04CD94|nr:DUF805 domain-containing protein [Staphylococcus agnetis]SUK08226.1 membrane protein [Staphylococcus agnetis]
MIETPQVGFLEAFKLFWLNYINFKGRSRRSEYWWVMLWHTIIIPPMFFVGVASIFIAPPLTFIIFIIIILYSLATIIPNLSLTVRRFHDNGFSMVIPIINVVISLLYYFSYMFTQRTDVYQVQNSTITSHSGFLPVFISLILVVIAMGLQIFILVISCLDSKEEANKYGPSPKYVQYESSYIDPNQGNMHQQTHQPINTTEEGLPQKNNHNMDHEKM